MLYQLLLSWYFFETETWLSPGVSSGEVFPPYYNIFRRDKIDGYDAFDHSIDVKEYPLDSECEVMACTIPFSENFKLTVCSFYRPPNSNIDYM